MTDTPVQTHPASQSGPHLIVGGFVTLGIFIFAYLAFDDITTDGATAVTLEYICLLLCAAWYLFISVRLIRRRILRVGILSLVLLIGAIWGQRKVGPGTVPSLQLEYLATIVGLLWLLVLSAVLLVMGFRYQQHRGSPRESCR